MWLASHLPDINVVAAAALLVATAGCVEEGLKGRVTFRITFTFIYASLKIFPFSSDVSSVLLRPIGTLC